MKTKPPEQLSRQRKAQIVNLQNGKCQFHKERDIYKAGMCDECYGKVVQRCGIKRPHYPKSMWETLDYSKSNAELAEMLGVTKNAVEYHRK